MGCSAIVSPDTDALGAGPDAAAPPDALEDGPAVIDAGTDGPDSPPDATPMPDGATDASADAMDDGTMPDAGPDCEDLCDDSIACTMDDCSSEDPTMCVNTPSDDLCPDGQRCQPTMGCVPIVCSSDAECDDSLYCNGEETCDPTDPEANPMTGCLLGEAVFCDDGVDCTADACNEDMDICTYGADDTMCDDGIDCTRNRCDVDRGCVYDPDDTVCDTTYCRVGGSCSATDGCVGGAERDCTDGDRCTADTCDDAMMMCINELRDEDGDGFGAEEVFGATCMGGTDCDDDNDLVYPGATEYCNGRDDNCDGRRDEGCTSIPDTCMTAGRITMPATGAWTTTGILGTFSRQFDTRCDPGSGEGFDAVYYLDVTASSDIEISTAGSATDTVLGVSDSCAATAGGSRGSFRFACNDDVASGTQSSRLWVHGFGPEAGETTRRLYIVVKGYNSSADGMFNLSVSVTPTAADTCTAPLDISGGGTVWGIIQNATSQANGTCVSGGDADGREAIFTYDGPSDGTARFTAYASDFDPYFYTKQSPCGTGMQLACDDSSRYYFGEERVVEDVMGLVAGTSYYAFVDGADQGDEYFFVYYP